LSGGRGGGRLNEPFVMPDHHSEARCSTFFLVSIFIAMAGVMVG
jgi:hypothetical protein